jgi:RND family efflux transporter MFP subunit
MTPGSSAPPQRGPLEHAPARQGATPWAFDTGGPTRTRRTIAIVAGGTVVLAAVAMALSLRAAHRVNRVALAAAPTPVTVAPARGSTYRESRSYVGAVEPWIQADVGPQFISAYILTVLVRPGASVTRGQVLATLDCTHSSAATQAVEMQARAVDARLRATADEAARVTSLLDGGFVAPNEAEQKNAASASEQAQLLETKANLVTASLDVKDCVLRAPFDGEVATRSFDPGAFVRPGASIVSVVDRMTVRVTVDASEKDFAALSPGTVVQIELLATGARLAAPIARTAPRADPATRTIHFEVDVPDAERRFPVGTTAIVHVDVGAPVAAVEVPLYAATVDSTKARLFVVDSEVAHARTLPVLGEIGGTLYFAPQTLPPGADVVIEGRELLSDGDRVKAQVAQPPPGGLPGHADTRGGGYGRPL